MKHLKNNLITSAVAVLLTACGGGSSPASAPASNTSAPPAATTPTSSVTPADLQVSVPALTYSASSQEFAFIAAFNDFRQKQGLGLLAQSAQLDKSAQNHLQYVLKNDVNNGGTVNFAAIDPATGSPMFHIESADKPLFTGVTPLDRAKAAGYAGIYAGEEGTFAGGKGAQVALDALIATVYHRAGLMFQGPRDVGVAAGQDQSQTFVLEFGYTKAQTNASDYVGVYPADNQTGVTLHAFVETPNPFPDLSLSNTDFPTKTGYPVSVVTKEGSTLEVVSFTMTEAGASAPMDVRVMTKDNDPNHFLGTNIAFLVAKAALKPSTTYIVAFSGRVNNVEFTKNWKFTTGA